MIGSPTFVGGAPGAITTWAGWQLTATSLGYKKGSDGLDVGTNYFGGAVVQPPSTTLAAPTGLRLVSVSSNKVAVQFDYAGTGQTGFAVNRIPASNSPMTTSTLAFTDDTVAPSTSYCYTVQAYNATATSVASNELCIKTADVIVVPPPPVDVSAPTAAVISPVNGSTVPIRATISINAKVTDDIGVTKVEFYLDGTLLRCGSGSSVDSCYWTVPRKRGRTFKIQVKAYDASGKTGISPTVSVTSK
jgi:hypothetical protein